MADDMDTEYFGSLVPFSDPLYYQGFASPYYKDPHHKVRAAIRAFTDEELTPNAFDWYCRLQLSSDSQLTPLPGMRPKIFPPKPTN